MSERPTADFSTTVATLRRQVRETITPLLTGVERVALIEWPDYPNVGDSAIWLGERKLLRELGIRVVYTASPRTYDRRHLERALGADGVIVLQGGGNFGDLWPRHEELRQRIVADFPDSRIIVFPQSIHYQDAATQDRAAKLYQRHPDLTVLVRDHESWEIAHTQIGLDARLCPDIAVLLDLERTREPNTDVVWLLRDDRERSGPAPESWDAPNGRVVDWSAKGRAGEAHGLGVVRRRIERALDRRMPGLGAEAHRLGEPVLAPLDLRTGQRLRGGTDLLSMGRVVVTDRLHGHLLCLLLNIPHVLLDNSYGKVAGFASRWQTLSSDTQLCTSHAAARSVSRNLAL